MQKLKLAIIGAGCSGLFLANLLKDNNLDIYIFEKNNKLGKKILASGNGKCNFTNIYNLENKYNDNFANEIINNFNVSLTLEKFKEMGLIYKNDDQGRCYPVSECSSSVLDCLKKGLKNIHILLDTEVKKIEKMKENKYAIYHSEGRDVFDIVACCSGSVASNLGSEKAYKYLDDLDLKKEPLKASLAPIVVKEDISLLKGTRVKCNIRLVDDKYTLFYEETGEVLFKDDSLSGIAIFNASSYINRKLSNYKIILDLSAGMSKEEIFNYINKNKERYPHIFRGYLNDKIAEYILKDFHNISKLNDEHVDLLVKKIMNLEFNVNGIYPLKDSQVCSGGISLKEVNYDLQLKKYPNIYVGGELLDIDGVSGGYNMQFAWSCAGVIAKNIKKKLGDLNETRKEKE